MPAFQGSWIDAKGRYRERRRDEWGVLWQHLIFGVAGHPLERPLDDWAALAGYRGPVAPAREGPDFDAQREQAARHMDRAFLKSGWISVFETMPALRRFEDVLRDLASGGPEIHRLADLVTEYRLAEIE